MTYPQIHTDEHGLFLICVHLCVSVDLTVRFNVAGLTEYLLCAFARDQGFVEMDHGASSLWSGRRLRLLQRLLNAMEVCRRGVLEDLFPLWIEGNIQALFGV